METLCYVCGRRPAVVRDHCHESGLIRGLLCNGCNTLAQNPELIWKVLAYVEASPIGMSYAEWVAERRRERQRRYYAEKPDWRRKRIANAARQVTRRRQDPDYRDRERVRNCERMRRVRALQRSAL